MAPLGRVARRAWIEIGEGLSSVAGDRVGRAIAVGLLLGVAFAAMDNTALVFLTRDELGGSAAGPGVALSVFGVGMIVVPLLLLVRRRAVPGLALMAAGLVVSGVGLGLPGVAPTLVLAVLAFGLAGAGNGLENIGTDTAVGEQVPSELPGRVFGAVHAPLAVARIAASAIAGPLVEATSAGTVFVIAGVGTLAAAVLTPLPARSARADARPHPGIPDEK